MSVEELSLTTGTEAFPMTSDIRDQLLGNLIEDKEYRKHFVIERISTRLPLRIRSLRGDRTQKQIAELAGKAQTWISKLEDPNYGKFTLATLLDVATAFDVGLDVDFVPFSELLDEITNVTPNTFAPVPSFEQELQQGAFDRNRFDFARETAPKKRPSRELMQSGTDAKSAAMGGSAWPIDIPQGRQPHHEAGSAVIALLGVKNEIVGSNPGEGPSLRGNL